jgi:hypothetical protein
MPSAQFLGDPLDGTAPAGHHLWWADLAQHAESDEQREIIKKNEVKLGQFAAAFRPHYYVSCWHVNHRENPKCGVHTPRHQMRLRFQCRTERYARPFPVTLKWAWSGYIDYSKEHLPGSTART